MLGNETSRKTCIKEADLQNKSVKLTCSFNASEIVGTTEIGVYCTNQSKSVVLISHDIFEKIENSLINNLSGSVEVEYTILFTTSTTRKGWVKLENYQNVYYIYEPSNVTGVIEEDVNGYTARTDIASVENNKSSYYYDSTNTRNLYIHTMDDENPNNQKMLIQTKEDNKEV